MRRLLLVALTGLLLIGAAPAAADTRTDIFRDCQDDGQLAKDYAPADLRDAQKKLPDDLREYSDCEDVLRRAALSGASGGDGSGGSGSGGGGGGGGAGSQSGGGAGGGGGTSGDGPDAPENAKDQKALDDAGKAGDQPLSVGDGDGSGTITPVAAGGDGDGGGGLPTALIVALIVLGLAGVALSVPPLRRRLSA